MESIWKKEEPIKKNLEWNEVAFQKGEPYIWELKDVKGRSVCYIEMSKGGWFKIEDKYGKVVTKKNIETFSRAVKRAEKLF